jgi:hypothetical protein
VSALRGLSCYTAALHGYLAAEWDASALLARSVRLAVRVDLPDGRLGFSHHDPALDRLPDGSRLAYAGAGSAAAAAAEVADELAEHGRVLVVVDSARLPWSVTLGARAAPHWLLVDGREAGGWHVVDGFSALLPAGEQRPHSGWLSAEGLCHAMTLPERWEPEQELRSGMAFGGPVPVPPVRALWLRRSRDRPAPAAPAGRWLVGDAHALPFLADYVAAQGARAEPHLDDVWAAAGHRAFAYRWRLGGRPGHREREALEAALARWESLPQLVRFAVESACRGRPRASLVRSAVEAVLVAEEDRP